MEKNQLPYSTPWATTQALKLVLELWGTVQLTCEENVEFAVESPPRCCKTVKNT